MKTRHKIPAVFSIYMVDVLCCALGCVILLWQLNHHDAAEQTAMNEEIRKDLEYANLKINALSASAASLSADLDTSKKLHLQTVRDRDAALLANDKALALALVRKQELDDLRKIQADAEALIALLRQDMKGLEQRGAKTSAELADKSRAHTEVTGKLTLAEKQIRDLTSELAQKGQDARQAERLALVQRQEYDDMKKTLAGAEALIGSLRQDLKGQTEKNRLSAAELADKIRAHADLFDKLAEAERKLRVLTSELAHREADTQDVARRADEKSSLLKLLEQELNLLRVQNKETMAKLGSLEQRSRGLEEDLQRGKLALSGLERERITLAQKATAAENRFAGVTLTGRRVIFLVDMSGSMEMVDDATLDPDKWPIVCDTVASIMRSLPDLRTYQVIVFSDRFKYAFGHDGKWVEYNPEISPKKVADGLKAIKPKGGTNMYAAFQEAFRYRDAGLDTVYVFSDGLPNIGEGLPADSAKLSENQRGEILGKHIRQKLKNNWNRPLPGQQHVRINCIGFFFESPDLGAFLWALAREHDGSFVGMSRP